MTLVRIGSQYSDPDTAVSSSSPFPTSEPLLAAAKPQRHLSQVLNKHSEEQLLFPSLVPALDVFAHRGYSCSEPGPRTPSINTIPVVFTWVLRKLTWSHISPQMLLKHTDY